MRCVAFDLSLLDHQVELFQLVLLRQLHLVPYDLPDSNEAKLYG